MRESYVPPVTGAREPAPEWHAVWRFRVVTLVLMLALAGATVWGVNQIMHLSDQDPTSGIPSAPPSATP